ncbi:hypothetical protein P154DRAFT_623911 [Amniculicola lignicola CBS 123094]|uniref:Uncharacterized protein n=1 Tax=Amniculicola lignicola CBS 123094 TaxID=1392246 RepID=A0A6A5W0U8_9PLEO|nr:hypothetical protein P154DRAFT_623911 [Amniculicola lignicola CBS 123094]
MADAKEDIFEFEADTIVTVAHNRLKHTYDGYDLARSGTGFQTDLSDYFPIIFSNGVTNKSKSRGKQQRSIDWWRAQCAFRGLATSGGVLEKKAKLEWKNLEVINRRRARQRYHEEKSKDEQKGIEHLRPVFIDNDATAVFVFKKDCQGIQFAAQKVGLHFKWIYSENSFLDLDSEWIIIGRTLVDVEAKAAAIRQEREDRVLAQDMQRAEEEKAARGAQTMKEARVQASVADLSATQGEWDVTGAWKISYPDFHDPDYYGEQEPTLTIYRIDGTKVSQMFGKFDFGTVKGWLRFEDPATPRVQTPSVGQKRKKMAWDSFLVPLLTKPSPTCVAWNYRWRGRGNGGDGYMEHDSEEYQCSMIFSGKGGCALSGTFDSDFLDCEFTGVKIGTITPDGASAISIEAQWGYLYDSAYLGSPR